jgi:GDP-L-fucose synthase
MEAYNSQDHVNIGTGKEVTIKELTIIIKEIVGFEGKLKFNNDKSN